MAPKNLGFLKDYLTPATVLTKLGGLGETKRPGDRDSFKPLFMEFFNDDSREMGTGYLEAGNSNRPHLKKTYKPSGTSTNSNV